jgi:tetratricopeptide (TPR) repeat protein
MDACSFLRRLLVGFLLVHSIPPAAGWPGQPPLPAAASSSDLAAEAHALWISGKVFEAKALLEKAAPARPDDARLHFELGRISLYTATASPPPPDLGPAVEAIEKAVQLDPENPRYRYWAGVIAFHQGIVSCHGALSALGAPGAFGRSIRHLEKAVELKPDHLEARMLLIAHYARLPWILGGNREKAEKHAQKLGELDPCWGVRGRCDILLNGDKEVRIALWKELIAKDEKSAAAREGIAREYLLQWRTDDALPHVERAIELDPSRREILLDLASHLQARKRLVEAEAAVRRYLASKPDPVQPMKARALRRLAHVSRQAGKAAEADALFARARKLDPIDWAPGVPSEELYGAP